MRPPVRIGVLSFAHYHANFWSEAFTEHPDAEIAGIWDDDPVRGAEAAGRFATPFLADLDALLGRCDAVAICSETAKHAALVARAAAAGRAILCEKPLADSLASARAIADAVAGAGVTFMQSFPKRFDPVSHELKRLVDHGALGRIHLVRVRHGHYYGLQPDFRQKWYVDPALSGGGALLDEGVHGADLLAWLFGPPAAVSATTSSAAVGLPVEDTAVAVFRWGDGMLAELASSFLFAAADVSIELYGAHGTALVSGVDLASRDITERAFLRVFLDSQPARAWTESPVVPRFKTGRFHHQNAIAFVRCLVEGTPPPITLADGYTALAMIAAAYDSARTGREQPIVVDPRFARP